MASSYRIHFKKREKSDYFIKQNFEYKTFCGSKYNDSNSNCLSRLQITFASAINKHLLLPKFIIVILDDDLIQYLGFYNQGKVSLYGEWLQWLIDAYTKAVKDKLKFLPVKAKRPNQPMVYWVEVPNSVHFNKEQYQSRIQFNLTLQSIIRQHANMRTIKLKDDWSMDDSNLVSYSGFSATGFDRYWDAIDKAFKFNVAKRDEYLVKEAAKKYGMQGKKSVVGSSKVMTPRQDDIPRFFARHRSGYDHDHDHHDQRRREFHDHYHWARDSVREDIQGRRFKGSQSDRFLLPKPKR